jgi:CSLREA domain-containing protein
LYEGDVYGSNDDPTVVYFQGPTGVESAEFLTHPNDLMNRRQASPAGGSGATGNRETTRQFISDLDVKILADAYGYSVVLPSELNSAHAMLDVWTSTLLVQGSARNNATGVGVNDTINLQRVTDSQGDDIQVSVAYSGTTYTERVPFAQVTNIIIHGNGGSDSITVNPNVSATKPWQEVQYVVSSNQDAIETSASIGGGSLTDGIVDLSSIIPGSQTTLRAAIREANEATIAKSIYVGRGNYNLTLSGTGGDSQGDIDIAKNVTIIGAGAGATVINGSNAYGRIFDVASSAVLNVSRLTLALAHGTSNSDQRHGGGIRVQNGGQLHMDYSAVVGNESGGQGYGGGIYFATGATGSIESSVINANWAENGAGGLYVGGGSSGAVTLKSTIIANNFDEAGSSGPNIYVGTAGALVSEGYNRFTAGYNSNFTPNTSLGDDVGSVDYVVTSIADTYDGSADKVNMSLRDAIHQANSTAGEQEIWLAA